MASYISDNPQFIVNGFIHAGITKALNGEDINDASIATTTSEESDDDEDNTPLTSLYYNKTFNMIIMIMITYKTLNCNMS